MAVGQRRDVYELPEPGPDDRGVARALDVALHPVVSIVAAAIPAGGFTEILDSRRSPRNGPHWVEPIA